MSREGVRSLLLSGIFLLLAVLVGGWFFWPALEPAVRAVYASTSAEPPKQNLEERLRTKLPETDPLLIHRVVANWGSNAIKAGDYGEAGLLTLEAFEDEADYCLQHDPKAFESLAGIVKLDPVRFRLATGPWNRAVLDWAQNGKLDNFRKQLEILSPDRLRIAEAVPAALPLVAWTVVKGPSGYLTNTGIVHGDYSWRSISPSTVKIWTVLPPQSKQRET